jgi:hypothetical protein
MSEYSSLGAPTPNIVISGAGYVDGVGGEVSGEGRAQSPPETLIPATDTMSTRPTRGGVAYPFRLKVDGKGAGDVNASTMTLQSVSVRTPGVEEVGKEDVELGAAGEAANDTETKSERPVIERFVTAGFGELDGISGVVRREEGEDVDVNKGEMERPGVERFETAQEDLSTLASVGVEGNGKA